jgi:hypothetical protein
MMMMMMMTVARTPIYVIEAYTMKKRFLSGACNVNDFGWTALELKRFNITSHSYEA